MYRQAIFFAGLFLILVIFVWRDLSVNNEQLPEVTSPTVDDAREFVERAANQLEQFSRDAGGIAWLRDGYITEDSNRLADRSEQSYHRLNYDLAREAQAYLTLELPDDLHRQIVILNAGASLPVGETAKERAEIVLARQRLQDEPSPENLFRWVEIINLDARRLGFKDVTALWSVKYEMPPEQIFTELDRLWKAIKPLQDALTVSARKAQSALPVGKVGSDPWGSWRELLPIVYPEGEAHRLVLDGLLKDSSMDIRQMARMSEAFNTSIGLPQLPDTFWERSRFDTPVDHEMNCRPTGWSVLSRTDVRVSVCGSDAGSDEFRWLQRILPFLYYDLGFSNQPTIYGAVPHLGFHFAHGYMNVLSLSPAYLQQVGLLDPGADLGSEMATLVEQAYSDIPSMAYMIAFERWRWRIFSGDIAPENYVSAWIELINRYQGVPIDDAEIMSSPLLTAGDDFVWRALSVPMRYQFFEQACLLAKNEGPLHQCSFFEAPAVGDYLSGMLEMGRSKPWPLALEAFTGSQQMQADSLIRYFAPLAGWLSNRGAGGASD